MHDSVCVAVGDTQHKLEKVALNDGRGKGPTVKFKVFFEVVVEKVENQVEFVLAVHDVAEFNDVCVLDLFEKGYFADRCRGHAFVLVLEADFL